MKQMTLDWHRHPAAALPEMGWPFVPSAPFAQALRRLLAVTEGLPLVGWESSCRWSPGHMTPNRLLLGLNTASVAAQRLTQLPRMLGMPEAMRGAFLQELPDAHRLMLAAEQASQGVELKVYHEFLPRATTYAQLPDALGMRGRKWRGDAVHMALRTTDYLRPTSDGSAWSRWLRERPGLPAAAGPAMDVASHAVDLYQRAHGTLPDFLTVTESPSPRLSCCIRLDGQSLTCQALRPALKRLAHAWHLPETLLARLPGQRRLSWLAVGTDAAAQPFLTLYAVSSLADVRQAITLGAFDDHS